ncbi:hypothetical protein WJR50_18935 [Catalinimonas sp. 4WD22]|uniref:hypothetical protein n=1 Tax=Catalinimonas locisalis TaxID=3133978 RepID=UPI003100F095
MFNFFKKKKDKYFFRQHTSEFWRNENPVIAQDEIVIDIDSDCIKIGDGKSKWSELIGVKWISAKDLKNVKKR